MNTSKIANILHLFENYRPHIVNDHVTPNVVHTDAVRNESGNEVVYLGWGDEGLEYQIKFNEQGLSNARVENGNLVMEDIEGDEIEIEFMESRKQSLVAEDLE